MTLKALFLLVFSFALLTKGRSVEPEYDCLPYDSYGYHLLARKLECNDDKPMHCAQLLTSKELTVRCLKPKICTQGQQPFIRDRSDTVSCGFCLGATYNSIPSRPSYFYSLCTPMTKLTKGRILCEHLELRTSDPDYHKYNRYIRCNVSAGYILDDQSVSDPSRDRQGYCTNATDPRCIKYSCEKGLELIKNYSCVKNCSSDEYRAGDQTCVKLQTGQTSGPLTTHGPSTTPGSPLVTIDRSSTQPVTQTTEPMKSESTDNTKIIFITIGVVVLVMAVVVVAGYLFCCCKRDRIRQSRQNRKGFPHGRQSSVDHSLHEEQSKPKNNDQPITITVDNGDRAVSSPLLSEEIHLEHAAQPNQTEDPPFGSRDDNTDDHQEKRPPKATIINEANSQIIGKQVVINNYISYGKESERKKDEEASEENSDSDGYRSWYKRPCPETGADDQQSNQLNRDNSVNLDDLDESTSKRVVNILDISICSTDKKRSPKNERPSKKKCNGNKSPNDTKNYPYPLQETEQSSGPTTQENIDNERRQSISEPETRQVKTDDELSMDTPGDNDETFVKFVEPADKSEPCIRTLDDLKGKLQCAGSPEEKVDISLEVFRKLRKEGYSWNTFHCCCNLIHEKDFLKEMIPNRKAVPCKPDSPTKKYCNTPKGFTAFVSTGDYNSCLYQSVSLLLGKESLYKLLRLMTAVFAAHNFEMAAKQIMAQLNYEGKDVHHFYIHHLDKRAYEELHAKEQHEQNVEEWNKIYLQELIMETPVLNTMSSQIHAMFLCGAIKRPIRQYLQAEHKDYMFHDELDPKACFNDGSYDESLPDLCIMWVNNENDPNKDINHVVPLWKEEEEEFHRVRQPAEATAVKSIMATQEDTKHNTEKSDDGTDKNDYKTDADNYDDDVDVDDDDEKDQLL